MGNDKAVKDKAVCYSNRVEWLQRELDGLQRHLGNPQGAGSASEKNRSAIGKASKAGSTSAQMELRMP